MSDPRAEDRRSDLAEGDDVIVVFPSGRQVAGRVKEFVYWNDRLYDVVVQVEEYGDTRQYWHTWVFPWGEAPDPKEKAAA